MALGWTHAFLTDLPTVGPGIWQLRATGYGWSLVLAKHRVDTLSWDHLYECGRSGHRSWSFSWLCKVCPPQGPKRGLCRHWRGEHSSAEWEGGGSSFLGHDVGSHWHLVRRDCSSDNAGGASWERIVRIPCGQVIHICCHCYSFP